MKLVTGKGMWLASALVLVTGPVAVATAGEVAVEAAAEHAAMNQLRVVRDKLTGELRAPDNEELKALVEAEKADKAARKGKAKGPNAMPEAGEALLVKQHGNGMKSAQLTEEYLVNLQGHRDAHGAVRLSHDRLAATHSAQPAPAAAPTE